MDNYLNKFDYFLLESYGRSDLINPIIKYMEKLINDNIVELIKNGKLKKEYNILQIGNIVFNGLKINIKISDNNYGNINPFGISYENNSINGLILNLEMKLSDSEIKLKKLINNYIFKTISHEMTHVIELYLTNINKNKLSKSWNDGSKLSELKSKYKSNTQQDVLYFLYLSLPHEIRARVSSLYDEIKINNIKYLKDALYYIKKSIIYNDVVFLSNLKSDIILNKLKNDNNYLDFIKDINEIFFNGVNIIEHEKYFIKLINKLNKKFNKMKSKLLKVSYLFENNLPENTLYNDSSIKIDYNFWNDDKKEI